MTGVVILHGWSDKGESFESLRAFLHRNKISAKEVWLGNYISLDDDVRVEDVAKRMQAVVEDLLRDPTNPIVAPFDLITHSTGALVAREWLATFYPDGKATVPGTDGTLKACPVRRVVMLAPANFGSVLAAVGKSMIGRLTRGASNGFQTGQEMLRALELGSPYQWNLTQRDLLARPGADTKSPFGPDKVLPFVIVGSRGYDEGLRQIINENGSDGTVRVCAANLNCVGMTLDFTPEVGAPILTPWTSRTGLDVPFAVLPERDHSEITHPEDDGQSEPPFGGRLAEMILTALRCDGIETYKEIAVAWQTVSNQTAMLALTPEQAAVLAPQEEPVPDVVTLGEVFGDRDHRAGPEHFHRYLQVNVMVRDDYGQLVTDYFLEFSDPSGGEKSALSFHRDVLRDVHPNSIIEAYRCLFIDHTNLVQIFYADPANARLAIDISATAPGKNVRYFDSKTDGAIGEIVIHAASVDARGGLKARLIRNQTHFVEVIIPRRPVEEVFSFLPQTDLES